jgi:hypothetical protein
MMLRPLTEGPEGGALAGCFDWHIPDPARPIADLNQMGAVYVWGPTPAESIRLEPGESYRVTQYFVAFTQYPLAVNAGSDQVATCEGPTTTLGIEGDVELSEPTAEVVHHRWSSPDPRVTFADSTSPVTQVAFTGIGSAEVTLTVSVGAYEASDTVTLTVEDVEPPVATVRATPATLWPPNHRMVPVTLELMATDVCDDQLDVRLIRAESSQPDDALGDGSTEADIQGADLGTDDRTVLLRAERQGAAARSYELEYEITDDGGNSTRVVATIEVPHDQRARSPRARARGGGGSRRP